jgi:hypothetical protein
VKAALPPPTVAGLMLVSEGTGAAALTTVNAPASVPAPLPDFVTVTSRLPGAAPPVIVNVAVSWVADTMVTLLPVTPAPLTLTVAPAANPDPLIVTGSAVPVVP